MYVRGDLPKGQRKKLGMPLPPFTLARRYRFLDKRITLKRETLNALVEAGLVREYDPVEALAGLKSALGKKANSKRRLEALVWAFKVWVTAGPRVEDEVRKAELYVPTLSGWRPANIAVFSSSWTRVGSTLENYLIEAAEVSADCRRVRDLMLVGHKDWPVSVQDAKRNWTRFLELIGVANGLRPIPARIKRAGSPVYHWHGVLRRGKTSEGLDENWCGEVARVSFSHPYTYDYRIKGEAWRLPGQIEHEILPESTREAFCVLIFEHIKNHGTQYFQFEVGRFKRSFRLWDRRELPTPLATFLRAESWIAASTRDGIAFRKPRNCWASRVSRGGPPRFIDRVPESLAHFSEGGEWVELAFGKALGLRDWHTQETAVARLRELAHVAPNLVSNERPTAIKEYRRAWQDVVETGASLPSDLKLIVTRHGQLDVLRGSPGTPADVVVSENARGFEARVLSTAGQPVLDVGSTPTDRITALLKDTGTFVPRRLDGIGVQLLVDGESFVPQSSDALLTTLGLEWLPEALVLGNELRGEQLERGIQSSTIDRRVRAIRVRRCASITLVVDDEEVSPSEHLRSYAFEHDTLPTLILTHDLSLDWKTLAGTLSGVLSRLIDSRLRSARLLLLQLALDRASNLLEAPSDEALARALDCDVQTIHDHRAALRTDLEHVLHLLVPVVAYYGDVELSRQLRHDVDRAGTSFDVKQWLQLKLSGSDYAPELLIDACEHAANRTELRRNLALDYERFNRILLELGERTLSNEVELRQLYDAYIVSMRPEILERLRRHHVADFQQGNELTVYTERKKMAFLAFNEEWVLTRETLEMELVEAHISALLADTLGDDVSVKLPRLNPLVRANRTVVRETAARALPVLRVWCRRNGVPLPKPWSRSEAQTVVVHLENHGLLDFEIVESNSILALCKRASCWPTGMPETLDEGILGLDRNEVQEEEQQRERERQQREIARRSIVFAGNSLDTGEPMFASKLQELAEACLSKDESWFGRSRQRTRLFEFENVAPTRRGSSASGKMRGKRRLDQQLSEAQRQAMGLASEWLAYHFLLRRHSN